MDTQEQPKRIQRRRTKDWKMPENTIYVGRPSKWGNPFTVKVYGTNAYAVQCFRQWLLGEYFQQQYSERRQWILDHIQELKGKNLACWCNPDESCHANVLLELANQKSVVEKEEQKNE